MKIAPLIAYYRVSTEQQKRSGLGLLAQQRGVAAYVRQNGGKLLREVTEIESGRDNSRPQLREALRMCRVYGATLVIARLDRLARSVTMISSILKSGVEFIAADMPLANRFTIHILAAVAEYEAKLISDRTKAAFAAANASGRKFGCPTPNMNGFPQVALKARVRTSRERSKARALDFLPLLCELRDRGETIHGIALQLTAMNIATPRHGKQWTDRLVSKMFEYAGERKPKRWSSRRTVSQRLSMHCDMPVLIADNSQDASA
jgi:DNA invertase Pin-like site-specific DNA recombinase